MSSTSSPPNSLPKVALGTWSWGSGFAGGDQVFGNRLDAAGLKPVFDAALAAGLTLWDTAAVYGMGSSEAMLGSFVKQVPREHVTLSTKFTPQIANTASATPVADMLAQSCERLGVDSIDLYWIHNPTQLNHLAHHRRHQGRPSAGRRCRHQAHAHSARHQHP